MSIADKDEVRQLFQYPLLEALAHRRARRFPWGCTMKTGTMQHTSQHPPLPLNDLETALLCWAGAGITGTITGDLPPHAMGTAFPTWVGRTIPCACNLHNTKLFFTNDNGAFIYDPQKATKVVEIETEADRERIMTYFQQDCVKLSGDRAEFMPEFTASASQWNANKPGTTVFMPIVDQSEQYLNGLFTLFIDRGYKLIDDLKGGKPAGIGKWSDSGAISGPEVPLSSHELGLLTLNLATGSYMLENMHLVVEAMGLGALVMAGYSGTVMLGVTPFSKGLGFRSTETKDGKINPVGLDGILEAYCPPYYMTMDDAVDAFVQKKFGPSGTFAADYPGIVPFRDWKRVLPGYGRPSQETIDIIKAYCNYVYDTYGRFPGTFDTILLPAWLQAHHLEVEFYDKYVAGELVNETHRRHMELWHK